ncbi:unnamed protein product [Lupinus luteus]|uniref:Uncharacterized protein n=1 Tax=Lupinus luteus TaxID=3873 RepID=A0AAV1WK15_LUPLU
MVGLDLKTTSGGSIANVMCIMCTTSPSFGASPKFVFQEWLITILFAPFLIWSTSRTYNGGLQFWKVESEKKTKVQFKELENGTSEESLG